MDILFSDFDPEFNPQTPELSALLRQQKAIRTIERSDAAIDEYLCAQSVLIPPGSITKGVDAIMAARQSQELAAGLGLTDESLTKGVLAPLKLQNSAPVAELSGFLTKLEKSDPRSLKGRVASAARSILQRTRSTSVREGMQNIFDHYRSTMNEEVQHAFENAIACFDLSAFFDLLVAIHSA